MKIAMAGDHAGFTMKKELKGLLEKLGHEVIDFGPFNDESCDLPDFIYPASLSVILSGFALATLFLSSSRSALRFFAEFLSSVPFLASYSFSTA